MRWEIHRPRVVGSETPSKPSKKVMIYLVIDFGEKVKIQSPRVPLSFSDPPKMTTSSQFIIDSELNKCFKV